MGGRISGARSGLSSLAIVLSLIGLGADDFGVSSILVPIVFLLILFVITQVPVRDVAARSDVLRVYARNPLARSRPSNSWQSAVLPGRRAPSLALEYCDGHQALFFSGMDIFIVTLFLTFYSVKIPGSKIDTAGRVPTPKPLMRARSAFAGRHRCSSGWWAWCGEATSPCRSGSSIA